MKNNITLSLKSIQWIDSDKTETELITGAFMEKSGNLNRIVYEDTSATGFEGSVTTLEVEEGQSASVIRTGTTNTALTLEMGKKHYCHYSTPFGSMQIGVFTHKIENKLEACGSLYLKYTLDMNSAYLSDNEIILNIEKNDLIN